MVILLHLKKIRRNNSKYYISERSIDEKNIWKIFDSRLVKSNEKEKILVLMLHTWISSRVIGTTIVL